MKKLKTIILLMALLYIFFYKISILAYPLESDTKYMLEKMRKTFISIQRKDAWGNELDPENTWGKSTYDGPALTQKIGIIWANGRWYTYYHQKMGGCFRLHEDKLAPYTEKDCWVSKDGVLYCGPYVCCAAYTPWFPPGTIVDTPFGKGLVVDYNGHCDLANGTKADIDICVTWGPCIPN